MLGCLNALGLKGSGGLGFRAVCVQDFLGLGPFRALWLTSLPKQAQPQAAVSSSVRNVSMKQSIARSSRLKSHRFGCQAHGLGTRG